MSAAQFYRPFLASCKQALRRLADHPVDCLLFILCMDALAALGVLWLISLQHVLEIAQRLIARPQEQSHSVRGESHQP